MCVFPSYRWEPTTPTTVDSACFTQCLGEPFCAEANHQDEFEEPEKWWKGVPGRGDSLSPGPDTRRKLTLWESDKRPLWLEGRDRREGWPGRTVVLRPLWEGPQPDTHFLHVAHPLRPEATPWVMRSRPSLPWQTSAATAQLWPTQQGWWSPAWSSLCPGHRRCAQEPARFSSLASQLSRPRRSSQIAEVEEKKKWWGTAILDFFFFFSLICKRQQDGKMCLWLWPLCAS